MISFCSNNFGDKTNISTKDMRSTSHIQKEVDENIPISCVDSGLRYFAQVKAKVLLQMFGVMCLK